VSSLHDRLKDSHAMVWPFSKNGISIILAEILVGELGVAGHAHPVVTDLVMDVIVIDTC
jgi:hypothetical protein